MIEFDKYMHGEFSLKPDAISRASFSGDAMKRCWDAALASTPWQPGNPAIPDGAEREFIVAVRRKRNGKVYVMSATFANKHDDDMTDREGEPFIADGWYLTGMDMGGEYRSIYEALCENGDEVVGWQAMPTWSDPA